MKNETEDIGSGNTGDNAGHFQTLTIDYELYEQYLEDSDLTEAQKREFLDTLWLIIVGFVDLGFGVHPVQQACEQNSAMRDFLTSDFDDVVKSKDHIPKTQFSKSAKQRQMLPAERLEP